MSLLVVTNVPQSYDNKFGETGYKVYENVLHYLYKFPINSKLF